jgi:4-carboxymuconolactone decarboxylase
MDDRERFAKGLEVRRAVLGEKHVNASLEKTNSFTAEFQDLVTRYAWGEMWTRQGLPRQTRSLVTLAMLIALNRGDEFRLHLRGAMNNGATRDQIKELLLQAAVYCGVPAANSAFRAADEIFSEQDRSA